MKYLAFSILIFLAVNVKSQSIEEGLIEVQIVNDSLQTFANSPELIITLSCRNSSDKKLLLYGFNSNLLTMYVDRLCGNQNRIGGGIGVLVFNDRHERVYAEHMVSDSLNYKPMPRERFEQLMEYSRVDYLSGTQIVKASGITFVDRKLDLHEFPLNPGRHYYLQVIVFGGESLKTKRVGLEQIERDKKAHNAELYQGCAISNKITFKVD